MFRLGLAEIVPTVIRGRFVGGVPPRATGANPATKLRAQPEGSSRLIAGQDRPTQYWCPLLARDLTKAWTRDTPVWGDAVGELKATRVRGFAVAGQSHM